MKTLLLSILFVVSFVAMSPGEDLTKAQEIDTYTVYSPELFGQTVKLKFHYRDGEMLATMHGKNKGRIKAVVPEAGQSWFNALPTQPSGTFRSVYARIERGGAFLLGRQLQNGEPVW